jgi:hypothetical protein
VPDLDDAIELSLEPAEIAHLHGIAHPTMFDA